MLEYNIRKAIPDEFVHLENFLYEAIFIPDGIDPPPREIINRPELRVYVDDFGSRKGDICIVAESDNIIIGAAWTRIMNDYGHIDNNTPSLAVSLYPRYRGQGIGTELMKKLLEELERNGFGQVSLSVQKENYAYKMYKKLGFEVVDENNEEYIMLCRIKNKP